MLIDSHCHLTFTTFDEDRVEVLNRAREAGIIALINPATNLEDSQAIITLAERTPRLFAAVGIHPNDTADFNEATLDELHQLAMHPRVVAIGEIGLDYYWEKVDQAKQQHAFEQQLALAQVMNKPVIIHQRESETDTMAILRRWAADQHSGLVLHSFSGSMAMAQEAIELGFYLGISGPITFKNAGDLPAIVAATPLDRLLVETDAPFLSPHPFRGKRNEPARVSLVAQQIAALHQLPEAQVNRQLTENTIALFKLPIALNS